MSEKREGLVRSVQVRLARHAKEIDVDPNLVLTRFAVERFLYRLSRSPHVLGFTIPMPSGGLLVGGSLRLEGTTDCGPEGCDPLGNFWFGTNNVTVPEGSFDFEVSLGDFERFRLFSLLPGNVSVFVGPPTPPPGGTGTGGGSTSYNGFFGASAAVDGLVPPRLSSPVIVTSATLLLRTVPEPGFMLLAVATLSLAAVRGRSALS